LSGKFAQGETIYIDTDKHGFIFSEKGFDGNGMKPEKKSETKPKEDNSAKDQKRKKDLEKLMQSTKEVKDATKDLQTELEEDQ
jgi:hypothetical protein